MRLLFCVCFALSFGGTAFAQSAPGDVAAGKAIAEKSCGACHDVTGKPYTQGPAGGPPFFSVALLPGFEPAKTRAFLDKPHKDVQITAKQKDDVVAYIADIKQQNH